MKISYPLSIILFLAANIALPSLAQAQSQWSGSFDKLKGRIIRSISVASFNKNLIIVGNKGKAAGDATLFVSKNGGVSWQFLNSNKPLNGQATDVQAVAAVDANIYLAGTWKHGLFRSSDGGASFSPVSFPSKDVRGFAVTDSGVIFAASETKVYLRVKTADLAGRKLLSTKHLSGRYMLTVPVQRCLHHHRVLVSTVRLIKVTAGKKY